jgi:hypothetical protein
VKPECFEFAEVGKVKHELMEQEVEKETLAQNRKDNSSGEENPPAMGFVQYTATNITWVV